MGREIRARFVNGKVELLEESDLEEGEEVWVVVPFRPKQEWDEESFMATFGAWKDDSEYWEEFSRKLYEERRRGTYLEKEHPEP